jgi:ABC-type amino acid transport substrate-binding protein
MQQHSPQRLLQQLCIALMAFCLTGTLMAQAFQPPLKHPEKHDAKTSKIDNNPNKTPSATIAVHPWQPWSGPNLQSMGKVPHLIAEVMSQDGTQTRFRFAHWGRALDMLSNNEVDAAIVWLSADLRTDPFVVSDPLMTERAALYFNKTKPYGADLDKISSGRMVWLKDYVYEYDVYNKLDKKTFTPFPVTNEQDGFEALLNKKADFFVVPYTLARTIVANMSPAEQQSLGYVMLNNNFPPAYFLINANVPDAEKRMTLFNKAVRRMRQDGRYDKIFLTGP